MTKTLGAWTAALGLLGFSTPTFAEDAGASAQSIVPNGGVFIVASLHGDDQQDLLISLDFAHQSLALLQKSLEFRFLIGNALGVALFVRGA
jgi:hypothetical protein